MGVVLLALPDDTTVQHIEWHFLLGVLSASAFSGQRTRAGGRYGGFGSGADAVLWICGFLLALILATPIDEWLQVPHGRYNLPFVPLLLCLVILLIPVTATGRLLLDSLPARAIGTVSFGVYLYHLPIQHLTARMLERQSLGPVEHWFVFGVCRLALTLCMAALSYLALERPMLRAARSLNTIKKSAPGER